MYQQSGKSWSYMEASEELDRIIRSNELAHTPKLCTAPHSSAATCSICGHTSVHLPIRSSSEVLSSVTTPIAKSFANTNSGSSSSNLRNLTKQSTTNLTHSANSSRQLRYKLAQNRAAASSTVSTPSHHEQRNVSTPINSMRTPDTLVALEAQSAANSVVKAFRELQAKTKMVESERTSAFVIRDELRQELAEIRRKFGLARNKQEARVNKHLQSIKASTDEQVTGYNYTRTIYQQHEEVEITQRNRLEQLTEQQGRLAADIERVNSSVFACETRLQALREELMLSRERGDAVERVLGTKSERERSEIQSHIDSLRAAIKEEKVATARADIRIAGLSKYTDIILKVNGDLCQTIQSSHDLDYKIAHIAHQQMKTLLKNREREVTHILNTARDIGARKAFNVSRSIDALQDYYLSEAQRRHNASLIENAARMAATSAASTIVAANLAATSSSCSVCYRPKFIPSSSKSNDEFNVIASVSKAAREARNLNARVAAKVKSLESEGVGALYKDVYRVDLEDMHQHLREVKKVLQSATP